MAVKTPRAAVSRYPIRAVSKLTGISIDTLRAWERRHDIVTPVRDDRGRMYSDADVARLRLIRDAMDQGHSIGRLAALRDAQLRELAAATKPVPASASAATLDFGALSVALRRFDAVAIDQEVARLAAVLPPIDLLRDVVMPMLKKVGDDWHSKKASVAHEHLISAAIRHLLGSFLRLHARRDVPARLLFATPSGDRHEIGTLGAAMLAARSGLGVAYLGPDLPARDILDSVKPSGARVLVIGLTAPDAKTTTKDLRSIVGNLPTNVELWAGGPAAGRYASTLEPRGIVLPDYIAFQKELVRLGGRSG